MPVSLCLHTLEVAQSEIEYVLASTTQKFRVAYAATTHTLLREKGDGWVVIHTVILEYFIIKV